MNKNSSNVQASADAEHQYGFQASVPEVVDASPSVSQRPGNNDEVPFNQQINYTKSSNPRL